jgi:hypothetical protein
MSRITLGSQLIEIVQYSVDMEVRMKKIKGKCCLQLEPIPIPNTNQRVIQYAHRAKQLVFKKLAYC